MTQTWRLSEKGHQDDIEATLTQGPKRLMDEWAVDGALFTPGSPLWSVSKPLRLIMSNSTPNTRARRC